MTKKQLKTEVIKALEANKASKKLSEAVIALLEEYTKTKSAKEKIEKTITIDGQKYIYCNRHEVYEPAENFSSDKAPECKLAKAYWSDLSKQIHKLEDSLAKALDEENFEEAAKLNKELKELKALRGARYNWEDNAKAYPEIDDYDYDSTHYLTVEQAKEAIKA